MKILQNISLSEYSTMGLGGNAAHLVEVNSRMETIEALSWAQNQDLPCVMIGGGSNIIWPDEGYPGLVIVNKIMGYQLYEEDDTNVYLTVGAGENWDYVVERSVSAGLTGIEALSLIPGTAGGTPVQNVGAYGQEIADTLTTVEAFDTQVGDFVTIAGSDCGFSYRNSRFKSDDKGRFFITGLSLHLVRGNPEPPYYSSVQTYFDENNIKEITPVTLRQAVVDIRTAKLPDPSIVHNTGSFFANPIITKDDFNRHNDLEQSPHWLLDNDLVKLSGAWLIEQAGFKDYHDEQTGMATWPTQPLVLVNEKAKSTADLNAFKQKIVEAVESKFGISLEQEPETVV